MANKDPSALSISLSLSDLEYALDLLSAEENLSPDKEKFIAVLIGFVSLGIFLLSCPLGLIILLVDSTLGWLLILTATLAALVFTIYSVYTNKNGDIFDSTKNLFEQLKSYNLDDVSKAGWEKQNERNNFILGCFIILVIPLCIWGVGWLIYGVTQKEIYTTPIYLIGIPFISVWVSVSFIFYRENLYYKRVLHLVTKFQETKQEAVKKDVNIVNISPEEVNLLSQIEAKKVQRSIAQVELNIQKLFAITINQNVVDFLKKLKERSQDDYYDIRDVIDALQDEPRPKTSIALREHPSSYQTKASNYRIDYTIDNERQRIEITQITKSGTQEILYGS